jgi:hypothetical protein
MESSSRPADRLDYVEDDVVIHAYRTGMMELINHPDEDLEQIGIIGVALVLRAAAAGSSLADCILQAHANMMSEKGEVH